MKLQLLIKIIFLQIILSKTLSSFGQDTIKITRRSFVESGVLVASASQTPFWLRANVLGVVPNTGTNFTLRGGFYQEYVTKNSKIKKYNWGYGLNSVANINQGGVDFILPEAYIKAKAGIFEIWDADKRLWGCQIHRASERDLLPCQAMRFQCRKCNFSHQIG